MGFPLYFGLPSEIFSVPGAALQIQQSTMTREGKLQFIKIGNFSEKEDLEKCA
jgi:hypothetical protein